MRSGTRNERYSFIAVLSACSLLSAFVFPIPVYAAGEIVAWGNNGYGQCNVPEPNTGFTAIAVGQDHSLGLKTDGSIVAWGYNGNGQCDVSEPNTGFMAIAAGYSNSFGLRGSTCLFNLVGDLNNDCKVDFEDFATMANNWLMDCGANPSNPACVPK